MIFAASGLSFSRFLSDSFQSSLRSLYPPVVSPTPVSLGNVNDTGFVVQGRYDLDAQSEIGLKAGLTEEQKKLFSYFVPVHGMSEQIVRLTKRIIKKYTASK